MDVCTQMRSAARCNAHREAVAAGDASAKHILNPKRAPR